MSNVDLAMLETLRPGTPPVDATWSAVTLESILTTPVATQQRRKWVRYAAAGVTGAVLVGGGVAYATGTVPSFVTNDAHRGARAVGEPDKAPDMRLIVDLILPNGTRFAAWRGRSNRVECTITASDWDGHEYAGDGGAGCVTQEKGQADLNRYQVMWAGDYGHRQYYPVLFGDTALHAATRVLVTGTLNLTGLPIHATIPVDPDTNAFSLVLPGFSHNPWANAARLHFPEGLKLTFLDAAGRALRTVSVS